MVGVGRCLVRCHQCQTTFNKVTVGDCPVCRVCREDALLKSSIVWEDVVSTPLGSIPKACGRSSCMKTFVGPSWQKYCSRECLQEVRKEKYRKRYWDGISQGLTSSEAKLRKMREVA